MQTHTCNKIITYTKTNTFFYITWSYIMDMTKNVHTCKHIQVVTCKHKHQQTHTNLYTQQTYTILTCHPTKHKYPLAHFLDTYYYTCNLTHTITTVCTHSHTCTYYKHVACTQAQTGRENTKPSKKYLKLTKDDYNKE